ncbi:MAG: cytochrome c oxidase subunit 4 [Actinophytocola sp.]|uniref:cytochrome c oxidase subunit 4 n=1 Tax=Actinophytocola sp. TaxID=1872138 RepID=UPI003D6AF4DF
MKVEARLFDVTTSFFFLSAIIYGIWAQEPVGTVGLILSGGLSMIIGSYFHFVARRLERRPEDNPDAEISDGAGEIGFFSAGSYWPVALAASGGVAALALAFWQVWLLVIGLALVLMAVAGLIFEYHTRPNETD